MLGIAKSSAVAGGNVTVVITGAVDGYSGLRPGTSAAACNSRYSIGFSRFNACARVDYQALRIMFGMMAALTSSLMRLVGRPHSWLVVP